MQLIENQVSNDQQKKYWESEVVKAASLRCQVCLSSNDNICAHPLISFDMGGEYTLANGSALCRSCLFLTNDKGLQNDKKESIDITISYRLRNKIEQIRELCNFSSASAFTRFLLNKYIEHQDLFTDIDQYQDTKQESRLHLSISSGQYHEITNSKYSANQIIAALYLIFEMESFERIPKREGDSDE